MKNLPEDFACRAAASCSKSSIFASPLRLLLDLVIARADQPKYRVNDEESKRAGEQQVHKQPHKINFRIQLAVARIGMRLILHKTDVRPLVAGAASRNQICFVDRRTWIGCRQNLVGAVAIPAPCRLNIAAQQSQLRVERVVISGELVSVARSADRRRLHAECRFSRLQNFVRRVAISADRRFQIALGYSLAMRSAHVVVVDFGVALPAGIRNVRLKRRALWIFVAENVVRAMTALAIRRHQQAFFAQSKTVNRIDVLGIDARQSMLLRHSLIAVALSASVWNIQWVNSRARVSLGKNLVGAAATARARMICGIAVNATRKSRSLVSMAVLALDLCHLLGVWILLYICVTVIALQAAMNALAEHLAVDCNAVAVRIGHARITVACKAFRLRSKPGRTAQQQCKKSKNKEDNAHRLLRHIPGWLACPLDPDNLRGFRHPAVFLPLESERCP